MRRIGEIIHEDEWKNHKVSNSIINEIQEMMNNSRKDTNQPQIKYIHNNLNHQLLVINFFQLERSTSLATLLKAIGFPPGIIEQFLSFPCVISSSSSPLSVPVTH